MADISAVFKKKVAGLPVGVWVLIIVAGVGVGIYIRNRAVDPEVTDAEDEEGEFSPVDTVPIESLPSEDFGYFPLTGGGAPTVYGGAALRLEPDTLRIKIIQPRRRRGGGKKRRRGTNFATDGRTPNAAVGSQRFGAYYKRNRPGIRRRKPN